MQIVFLILIGLAVGIALTRIFELVLKTNKKLRTRYYKNHAIVWGYHIHHSTYGLLCFLISAFLFFIEEKVMALFIMSFGAGIITMHTISDPQNRIVFIEKEK